MAAKKSQIFPNQIQPSPPPAGPLLATEEDAGPLLATEEDIIYLLSIV